MTSVPTSLPINVCFRHATLSQAPPTTSSYVTDGAELVVPTLSDLATDTLTIKNTG